MLVWNRTKGQLILFFPPDTHAEQADLKEQVERKGHEHHIKGVGGGGQNSRKYGNHQNSVTAISGQPTRLHQADPAQKDHGQRQFKDDPEGEDKQEAKRNKFFYGNNRLYMNPLVT